jgi:hypothetical protein
MLAYSFHHDYSVAPAGAELFSGLLLSFAAGFAAPSPLGVARESLSALPDSVALDPALFARESVLYQPDPLKTIPAG